VNISIPKWELAIRKVIILKINQKHEAPADLYGFEDKDGN
jgi:hypothetical protein